MVIQTVIHTYSSNKAKCFSYKGGCGVCVVWVYKEELAWAIDKWRPLVKRGITEFRTCF